MKKQINLFEEEDVNEVTLIEKKKDEYGIFVFYNPIKDSIEMRSHRLTEISFIKAFYNVKGRRLFFGNFDTEHILNDDPDDGPSYTDFKFYFNEVKEERLNQHNIKIDAFLHIVYNKLEDATIIEHKVIKEKIFEIKQNERIKKIKEIQSKLK